ncbi:MAG: Wzz/FepE/Etk N-terminal domain-containing protein [Gammaproteobacteria bacterium]
MSANSKNQDVDLFALVGVVVRRRYIVLSTFLIVVIAAVLIAMLMTPVYDSEVLLAPVAQEQSQGGLSSLAGQFGGLLPLAGLSGPTGSETRDQALAVLRSRSFTEQFIADNNLLPVLFADRWDDSTSSWGNEGSDNAPTLYDGYRMFDEKIRTIREDSTTGLVTLRIEWTDRLLARDWARDLIDRLNQSLREQAIRESNLKLEYLEKEVQSTSVLNLQEAVYGLMEQEISTIMAAHVKDQYVFKILDPAAVADADDFVRPKRVLIVIAGLMIGFILGLMAALTVDFISRYRSRNTVDA